MYNCYFGVNSPNSNTPRIATLNKKLINLSNTAKVLDTFKAMEYFHKSDCMFCNWIQKEESQNSYLKEERPVPPSSLREGCCWNSSGAFRKQTQAHPVLQKQTQRCLDVELEHLAHHSLSKTSKKVFRRGHFYRDKINPSILRARSKFSIWFSTSSISSIINPRWTD